MRREARSGSEPSRVRGLHELLPIATRNVLRAGSHSPLMNDAAVTLGALAGTSRGKVRSR